MRMLDLYCGEGLAAWGYWLSGYFSEIVGVDIVDQRHAYAFDFIQKDATTLTYDDLADFDFIHASPPCQAYSNITPVWARDNHVRLVAATHLMMTAAGKPHVIENVPGAKKELRPNVEINGWGVGLKHDRPRMFYVSTLEAGSTLRIRGAARYHVQIHGGMMTRADIFDAFGLSVIPEIRARRLTKAGLKQGIPPAMTLKIARLMFGDYRARVG